jgi:hypothetical protein
LRVPERVGWSNPNQILLDLKRNRQGGRKWYPAAGECRAGVPSWAREGRDPNSIRARASSAIPAGEGVAPPALESRAGVLTGGLAFAPAANDEVDPAALPQNRTGRRVF